VFGTTGLPASFGFMTSHVPRLPPPSRTAFLLDFDGTLVDIAPSPDLVVLPADLRDNLPRLRARCGGALAIVTGRPIAQLDFYFGNALYAVAGEHGTAIRHAPDDPIETLPLPDTPPHWAAAAKGLAVRYPGTFLEPKRHGFVLHYRAAPEAGQALRAGLSDLLAERPEAFQLMGAKMAWEVKPTGVDKGTAVSAMMKRPPFEGRLPVYIGDDITDEDGMRAARALGGLGLRLPDVFADAAAVRRWIAMLVGEEGAPASQADAWPV
jgi:trehalose 6-phosphate phosphatase